MSHAIVRLDNMHGTYNGADLVSFKYYTVSGSSPTYTYTAAAIDNGNIVLLGALDTDQREVFKATVPAADSTLGKLVLVASPELIYDESTRKTFADFTNEAGTVCRGFVLRSGDTFGVTIDGVGGRTTLASVVVGDIAECQAGTKIKLVASATASSTTIGKVIAKEGNYIVIRID